jgi:hypothetical protein
MSNLVNIQAEERLLEAFEIAFDSDHELRGALAYKLLDSPRFYLFCKEDAWQYLSDRCVEIYEDILKTFWNKFEGNCFDIRLLAETTYNIEI